jgi:hypothetical protein
MPVDRIGSGGMPSGTINNGILVWNGTAWVEQALPSGYTIVKKSSSETRTTNTLSDDSELKFPAVANGVYSVILCANWASPTSNNGIKHQIRVPSLDTNIGNIPHYVNGVHTNNGSPQWRTFYATNADGNVDFWTVQTFTYSNNLYAVFNLHIGATGGDVSFRWAQANIGNTTTVFKGSYLAYLRLL